MAHQAFVVRYRMETCLLMALQKAQQGLQMLHMLMFCVNLSHYYHVTKILLAVCEDKK
jgi:uncharacterized membrane protein